MPCLLRAGRVLSASCFFVWVIEPVLCMSNGVIPHQGMGRMDVFFKGCGGWMCFSKDDQDGCVFQGMAHDLQKKISGWSAGLCCQPTA